MGHNYELEICLLNTPKKTHTDRSKGITIYQLDVTTQVKVTRILKCRVCMVLNK